MGEAKRIDKHLKRIQLEGQGVWEIDVVYPWDAFKLHAEYQRGVRKAGVLLTLLGQVIKHVETANPPMLCLLCDRQFAAGDAPIAFVFLTGYIDTPSSAIVNGLCLDCAEGTKLLARITQKYKENMLGDLRVLAPLSKEGRA